MCNAKKDCYSAYDKERVASYAWSSTHLQYCPIYNRFRHLESIYQNQLTVEEHTGVSLSRHPLEG